MHDFTGYYGDLTADFDDFQKEMFAKMISSSNHQAVYSQYVPMYSSNYYTSSDYGITDMQAYTALLKIFEDMVRENDEMDLLRKLYMSYLEYLEEKGIIKKILEEK
jgi:hypothetical protein